MNTSSKTTKISSVFLATVLIAGMIAASPSLMTNALAQMDNYRDGNDYRDSKGKDVSVQKIDCSNTNVNVNGFELNVLPPELTGLASAQTQSGDEARDSNGFGSGDRNNGPSGHDKSGGVLCISKNNNNNVGAGDDDEEGPCDQCFANHLDDDQLEALDTSLRNDPLEIVGTDIVIGGVIDICLILSLDTDIAVGAVVDLLERIGLGTDIDIIVDILVCIFVDVDLRTLLAILLSILGPIGNDSAPLATTP